MANSYPVNCVTDNSKAVQHNMKWAFCVHDGGGTVVNWPTAVTHHGKQPGEISRFCNHHHENLQSERERRNSSEILRKHEIHKPVITVNRIVVSKKNHTHTHTHPHIGIAQAHALLNMNITNSRKKGSHFKGITYISTRLEGEDAKAGYLFNDKQVIPQLCSFFPHLLSNHPPQPPCIFKYFIKLFVILYLQSNVYT